MFRKKFIDKLKQKYKTGGTGTNLPDPPSGLVATMSLLNPVVGAAYQGYKMYTDKDYKDKVVEGTKNLYTKGKRKVKGIFNKLTTPTPITEEQKSLSYLPSSLKETSVYNKLSNLSDKNKKKLHNEYQDLIDDTEGIEDAGLMSQIKTFKNLDLSGIKELQNDADISKSEIRDIIYDKSGYHNMGFIKQKSINAALNMKGFKKGGIAYKTGGTQLEGGVMLPIPNSNAVEFKGKTHEQGGILLDEKTEVENNETMDKVIMKKGGKKDYFFSSYLKKGGLSFADMHKDILANGGTQEEINMLAKMQEKAAKRNPKQIARLGGVVQYEKGGPAVSTFKQWKIDNGYGDIEGSPQELIDEFLKYEEKIYQDSYPSQIKTEKQRKWYDDSIEKGRFWKDGSMWQSEEVYNQAQEEKKEKESSTASTESPFANKEEGNVFRQWINETYPEYAEEIDLDAEGPYNNSYIQKAWKEYGDEYKGETVDPSTTAVVDEDGDGVPDSIDVDGGTGTNEPLQGVVGGPEAMIGPQANAEQMEMLNNLETTEAQKSLYDKLKKKSERRGDIPTVAAAAGLAQLGPAAYSMFHKQPAAEQAEYTPGFTSPVVAEMAKAPNLDRIDYNAEKARNASQMNQINKYIETSGGGPANIVNKTMAYIKKQEGDRMIAAAESKANTAIANQEAQMKTQVAANNLQRAQSASLANMQMQMQETARKDQINAYNATARQKVKDDEEYQKYQGINTLGTNIAGLAGDYLSYKASERMARVMGSEGIYDRDAFRTVASKEISKSGIPGVCGGDTGIPCTDAHINTFITSQNKEQKT